MALLGPIGVEPRGTDLVAVCFNAMASHPLTERISLQLNMYNLANRYYFDEPHPAHLIPGPAFTALVGLNFKF